MRTVIAAAALLALGGCSWLYDSPYEEALHTGAPIESPPASNGMRDLEAALPYEQSPWFDEDRLNLPPDSPVKAYEVPEDRAMLDLVEPPLGEEQRAEGPLFEEPFDEVPAEGYYDPE